jgi:hypothetical protein
VGIEDRTEFWPPENENLCRRLRVEKSLQLSVPVGQNGRKANRTSEGKKCAQHFVELHNAPLIRRFYFQQNAAAYDSERLWDLPAGPI